MSSSPSSSSSDDEAAPEPARPDWQTEEDGSARRMVFLVTFAAVLAETAAEAEPPLRTLDGLTRADIQAAIADAVANPQAESRGRPRVASLQVQRMVVVLEQPLHFHVALKLNTLARFLPLKAALRARAGLASHWSTSHTQWWSAVRYCVFTTEHKPVVDPEPLVWVAEHGLLPHGDTRVNLYQEAQEPWNAHALRKRREVAEMSSAGQAAQNKKAKVGKFTLLDFTALVIDQNLTTPNAVLSYVQQHGSQACQLFCLRSQKRLPELLKQAVEWKNAQAQRAVEVESDWQLLQRLSQQQCNCGGACAWQEAAEEFAARNRETIDMDLLAASLANIICNGPSKTARVPLIAGVTNAGKSLNLDPLVEVFGRQHVDFCPALGATMPLSSLATCDRMRFIYWDEYSPTEFASRPARAPTIPAVTFKKLFAGQYLRLQVSQAHHDGNPDFRWTRGVAMTAPLTGLWEAKAPVTSEDVAHMKSRIIQFDALTAITNPLRRIPHCASTWCAFVVQRSMAYASRVVLQPEHIPIDDADL